MNTLTPKLLLERVPGISTESAGYGTSWYFAARTIGTFCGAFLLAKLSERGYFRINMMELIGMCDRIVIMKDGKISGQLDRDKNLDENGLISMMV